MKNTHIKAGQEVPLELRKEIYKEALEIIENKKDVYYLYSNCYELCFLLPCILWDLGSWQQVRIDGDLSYVKAMFPELYDILETKIYFGDNIERIEFLKSVI